MAIRILLTLFILNFTTRIIQHMRSKKPIPAELNTELPQNTYLNHDLNDLQDESWRPMKGQEKSYRVSNLGRVKKVSSGGQQKIIEQIISKDEWHMPRFLINRDWYNTHDVIAKSFKVDYPFSLPALGHINGVKTDNRPDNLEYCEFNCDDVISPYVLCDWKKLLGASASRVPVVRVSLSGARLSAYISVADAARSSKISQPHITKLVASRTYDEDGFYWITLQDYMHLPVFKKQAAFITKHQKSNHPWMQ